MGSHHLLFAAPLLLASPALAQDAQQAPPVFTLPPASSGNATPANPAQQGPELDVFRPSTAPATPPPAVTPTVVPPPVPVQPTTRPTVQPQPRPQSRPPEAQQRPPERETPAPAPAPVEPTPAANEAVNESAPAVATPEPAPAANSSLPAAAAPAPTAAPVADEGSLLPWIIGGLALLIALAGAAFALRRRGTGRTEPMAPTAEPLPAPADSEPVVPVEDAAPVAPPLAPAPLPVEPAPADEVPAVAVEPDRPWLAMDLDIGQARYSLMGVTIAYTLLLHNRGAQPAQDILVRGVVGNAGPAQQALLEGFFTGQTGFPLHSAVTIAPDETLRLSGELRLGREEILPVEMGQRSLLIPIAAFDTSYRWGADEDAADPQGSGRTARAFIVGQEQEPPADRLAPFRLDQGPRQYPRPAARAAAELPST
jgi:hypothetical protein